MAYKGTKAAQTICARCKKPGQLVKWELAGFKTALCSSCYSLWWSHHSEAMLKANAPDTTQVARMRDFLNSR